MKRSFCLAGFVCFVAILLPVCAPAPEPEPASESVFDQAAEEAAIRAWLKQRVAAANRHDAEALAAQFDENWESWDGTLSRATFEKSRTEFHERAKDFQVKLLDEIGFVFVKPDIAIYKHRQELTGDVDSDGKPLPPAKLLSARVLVKRNGKWLQAATFQRPIE